MQQWSVDFYNVEKIKAFNKKIFDNNLIENQPRFFYVKDNDNTLSSVSSTAIKYVNIDPFTQKEVIEVSLKDTKVDISNYSGFSNLLTQTESKLLNKGRSSISIEIKEFFQANDYVEISWEPGPTAQNFPLRWRVVANSTNLNPGEVWPSHTLTSDIDGEYYLSYFQPGDNTITKEEFTASIQKAFDNFPFKNFEVLAKGNYLHFRSTQEGKASESAVLKFSNSLNNSINVMGLPGGTSGNVNFIGASNKNKSRARISKSVAQGMLIDEYISTKGNFEASRKFDILGNTIVFSPYLDEPVYDENGEKLVDFKDSDIYMVVSIEKEESEIQLTSDSKMTTYQLFKPKFGILSVLPVKDFDTDFYQSDYTRSYNAELIKYFGRDFPPAKITSVTIGSSPSFTQTYTFDTSFSFDTYPVDVPFLTISPDGSEDPVLYNQIAQLRFTAPGATATLVRISNAGPFPVGTTVLLLPNSKHLYFSEDLLSKFKGFLSLSGVVSSEDEANFES